MADEKETGVTSLDNNLSLHLFSKDILLSYHNYLKWKDMYNFIQTSNVALGYFNDLNLWRKSLRRKLLIESIPQYLNWPLRNKSEMIVIQKKKSVLLKKYPGYNKYIKKLETDEDEVAGLYEMFGHKKVGWRIDVQPDPFDLFHNNDPSGYNLSKSSLMKLTPLLQAKVTLYYAKGIKNYENRKFEESLKALNIALEIAPKHDLILCRLGDTSYALRLKAEELVSEDEVKSYFEAALEMNPSSSSAYNGLALFSKSKSRFTIGGRNPNEGVPFSISFNRLSFQRAALLLDPFNTYTIVNYFRAIKNPYDILYKRTAGGTEKLVFIYSLVMQALKLAVSWNPNLFYARLSIADMLSHSRQYEGALKVLKEQPNWENVDDYSRRVNVIEGLIVRLGLETLNTRR